MNPEKPILIVTCEHAARRVPGGCAPLFDGRRGILDTHRAYDRGSLSLARQAARTLGAMLFAGEITRLVVDLNRSEGSRALFSPYSRGLGWEEKRSLLDRYYFPYREAVVRQVEEHASRGTTVVHLSVHTFAPVVGGVKRTADVGLLYDPSRRPELLLSRRWKDELNSRIPTLRVRRNYPYRGSADGLTTDLRRRFPPKIYAGVELEVNQRLLAGSPPRRRAEVRKGIVESLAVCLCGPPD